MNLKKVFAILLLVLFYFLIALAFFGCSSSKKLKDKEVTKSEVVKSSDSLGTTITKIKESEKEKTSKIEKQENTGFKIKVEDGKEVSVKQFDSNGKLIGETVVKGSGDVETKNEKKETNESKSIDKTKDSDSKATSKVSKKEDAKTDSKKLELNVEKKGFSFGDYIFWFVLIITIIVLIYLNNRFKWISIFKRKNNE
jgi:Flp pilus assembly protein TadB